MAKVRKCRQQRLLHLQDGTYVQLLAIFAVIAIVVVVLLTILLLTV